jgi:hypothetical protein
MLSRYGLALAAVITALAACASSASAGTWGQTLFDELSKDFGSVPRGPQLTHHFRVTNRTKSAVNISSVRVSCGCVTATAMKTRLEVGEETTIFATMDSTRFVGPKSVTIFVQFDAPQFEEVRLYVQANGRNDFTVTPDTLSLGQVKRGSEAVASTTVTFYGHNGARVVEAKGESNYVDAAVVEERRTNFEVTYKVTAKLRTDTPVGKWFTDVWLTTNVTTLTKMRIPLTVEVESPLTVSPNFLALGSVKVNEDVQRRVVVRGVRPFRVTEVKGGDAELQVSAASPEAREVHVLTVRLRATKAGAVDKTLRVVTDLPEDNEIDFRFNAAVGQ